MAGCSGSYGCICVAKGGVEIDHDKAAVAKHMQGRDIVIEVGLGVGDGSARTIGIDLGPGYIKENSQTS